MQKQEDEKLERRLHQVMEQIQPDEDAKDRMYLEIMRRASVAETPPAKPKPWYLRWQTSAGACTAALLCVVVVAAAVHGRMPQGGTGQLDIVSPTVTTQASELPADTEQPDETETRLQTEITAAETGVTVHSAGNASAAAESSTVPAEDEIVSPVSPEITAAAGNPAGRDDCGSAGQTGADHCRSNDCSESRNHCGTGNGHRTAGNHSIICGNCADPAEHLPVL